MSKMPLVDVDELFFKIEAWGGTNVGKTYVCESIAEYIEDDNREDGQKNKIIIFTNESNYAEGLEEWSKYKKYFEVYFHRNVQELEADRKAFFRKYEVVLKTNPKTKEVHLNVEKIRRNVLAIIVDETAFIYRELFVAREREKIEGSGKKFEPKHWGAPRTEFLRFMKSLSTLPCHFLFTSKVKKEVEMVTRTNKAGTAEWLVPEQTGDDQYRLFDDVEYEPSVRIHLLYSDEETGQENEIGQAIIKRKYYGYLVKQKADFENMNILIEKPTVKKVEKRLRMLRQAKQLRERKKQREREQVIKQ